MTALALGCSHSAVCHGQWAQRLHGSLNEITTR